MRKFLLLVLFLTNFTVFTLNASLKPMGRISEDAQKVYTGIYMMNIYDIDSSCKKTHNTLKLFML